MCYGIVAVVTERSPTWVTPILYSVAILLFGSIQATATGSVWLGIALCLASTWVQPLLERGVAPALPQDSFAYLLPSIAVYALLVLGSVAIGATIKEGGLLHRASGWTLVLAAASSLFLGPFLYALVLAWFGYQLVPRKAAT
jgi:hypothetical protein